ncbi:MAG: alpha-L-rhamnosidase [bacterium]|nr:alpha-L-rhamnosidase [bacterium]
MKNRAIQIEKVLLTTPDFRRRQSPWGEYGAPHAQWIWHPASHGKDPRVLLFRRQLTLAAPLTTRIHITADQRFELFIDGALCARGPERGDVAHWFVHSYDLILPAGTHTIVARCWWLDGMGPFAQMTCRGGFLLYAEGAADALLSTGTAAWEVCPVDAYRFERSPIMWGAQARTFITGAALPTDLTHLDDLPWMPATGGIGNHWLLLPATLPDMRVTPIGGARVRHAEMLAHADAAAQPVCAARHDAAVAAAVTQLLEQRAPWLIPANTCVRLLLDFDEYRCVYPHVQTSGGSGSVVRLAWAESLYEDPHQSQKGNRNEIEGKVWHGDGDTFYPDGRDLTFDLLWWRAARYVHVLIETGHAPLTIAALAWQETGYPLAVTHTLHASDPVCARVMPLMQRALQMCMHETYMDCPYYEQLMYVGDTRLEALVTYVLSHDDRLPRKALRMFDWSRLPEGFTQSRYPSAILQIIPPFSLWWICMVHDYLMWRDDPAFVAVLLPGVHAVLDGFERYRGNDNLLRNVPWWNYVDWVATWQHGVAPGVGEGADGMVNLQYVLALQAAAALETAVGTPAMARICTQRARAVRAAVKTKFWQARRGLFAYDEGRAHFGEQMQCLAVLAGACDTAQRRSIRAALLRDNGLDQASIYFSHYLLEALPRLNAMSSFFERLKLWDALPAQGFKTLPESPEPCRSDCHAWGAHPLYHFYTKLLGITPASPGFKTVRIAPQPCHLTQLAGCMPHPRGAIRVALDIPKKRAEIVLPRGVTGTFVWKGRTTALKAGTQRLALG